MNRLSRVCVLSTMLILLLPGLALAGTGGGDSTINLSSGTVQAWTATALGVARSLLLFFFVISFIIEALGRGPGAPRDIGAVVWRLVIAMVLLAGYSTIFGSIAQYSSTIAERIAPPATWDKLGIALKAFTEARAKMQLDGLVNADGVFDFAKKALAAHADLFSVIPFLDIFVTIIITVGQAAMWIVLTLGNVLTLLLYVLGPLAIAGAVPRGSDVGGRWFRLYISILAWPIIASLLVGLLTEFALQGLKPASPDEALFRSVGVAGLLCLASLAVPTIASGLIGGSLHAIGAGAATAALAGGMALKTAREAIGPVGGAVGSAARGGLGDVVGGIASSAAGGGGGGVLPPTPAWAGQSLGRVAPAVAAVSPQADVAMGGDIYDGAVAPAELSLEAPTERPQRANWAQGAIAPAANAPAAHQPLRSSHQPPPAPVEMRGPALDAIGLQKMRLGPAEGLGAPPAPAARSVAPAIRPVMASDPQASREAITARLPFVSEAAYAEWRKAHPGADYRSPEARQQLLDVERRLGEPPTPRISYPAPQRRQS